MEVQQIINGLSERDREVLEQWIDYLVREAYQEGYNDANEHSVANIWTETR